MSLRQRGHGRVVAAAGVALRAASTFIGLTTKKNTAAAITTNVISAFRKLPYRNRLLLIVKLRAEKSGLPPMAAINGVIRSATSAVTTALKARPITTATARSTRLPRMRNSRNSLSIRPPPVVERQGTNGGNHTGRHRVQQLPRTGARSPAQTARGGPARAIPHHLALLTFRR